MDQAGRAGHVRGALSVRKVLALPEAEQPPQHLGLAYDTWAPTGKDGKVPEGERAAWLSKLADSQISQDYRQAYERWKRSFDTAKGDRWIEVELASRLLIGHGNPSATEVGLTLQHTWGVPCIPGSALKGLLAHYVDAVYGPDQTELDDVERNRYRGVTWKGKRMLRGPGEIYRVLFGAPDADDDAVMRQQGIQEIGASVGAVCFHDALYVPTSPEDRPFATDVLTVHQQRYYRSEGREAWPNDYDSPNPVAFLTVRPNARMLIALSRLNNTVPIAWVELAQKLLLDALSQWGVGGKTSSGYGRLVRLASKPATKGPQYQAGDKIVVVRVESSGNKIRFSAPDGILGHFPNESAPTVAVGESVEAWVKNASAHIYTLTCSPQEKKKKCKQR